MNLEELKSKFIVDEDVHKSKLEGLLQAISDLCVIDKQGIVHISKEGLSATNKVKLVLAARYLASQLEDSISSEVNLSDLEKSTGIEPKQLGARASDAVSGKFAIVVKRGTYKAVPHKIEVFLKEMTKAKG